MTTDFQAQAERVAGRFCKEQIHSSCRIVGKGFVNHVYKVETDSRALIVRMNSAESYPEYVKEQWCIRQASAAGIPGPEVLDIGVEGECAYMLQSFVEGTNGLDADCAGTDIWRRIGEYARLIHAIAVQGYGEELVDPPHGTFRSPSHPGSDGSWQGYIRYNIDSLNETDPLLRLGVITPEQSRQAKRIFEDLSTRTFRFGLIHGDLSTKNVLVNEKAAHTPGQARITLLDWGGAEVYPVPHGELMQLLLTQYRDGTPIQEELEAFIEGYGVSSQELKDTGELMLLRSFDTLRWALDCAPDQVDAFAEWASHRVRITLDNLNRS